ncbi:MAG: hypothetical protein KDD67_14550 [Ignavibacteriae bacterium]|nr:hypothetical protein [Ignavibacteriota bacterium]MCB9215171.1 hypothetical protein [Ignavibacteria bacterium]
MKRFHLSSWIFLLFTLSLFFSNHIKSQIPTLSINTDINVSQTFEDRFSNDDSKAKISELQTFIIKKETELKELENILEKQITPQINSAEEKIDQIKELRIRTIGKSDTAKVVLSSEDGAPLGFKNDTTILTTTLNSKIATAIENYDKLIDNSQRIRISITNIETDINRAKSTLDKNLSIELSQQGFKKSLSLVFAGLIGLLITLFFYVIFKSNDKETRDNLLSNNGLQFVTLFVLIIAIILFGILSILEGKELAAIISGIAGYILGKGAADFNKSQGQNRLPTPDPVKAE